MGSGSKKRKRDSPDQSSRRRTPSKLLVAEWLDRHKSSVDSSPDSPRPMDKWLRHSDFYEPIYLRFLEEVIHGVYTKIAKSYSTAFWEEFTVEFNRRIEVALADPLVVFASDPLVVFEKFSVDEVVIVGVRLRQKYKDYKGTGGIPNFDLLKGCFEKCNSELGIGRFQSPEKDLKVYNSPSKNNICIVFNPSTTLADCLRVEFLQDLSLGFGIGRFQSPKTDLKVYNSPSKKNICIVFNPSTTLADCLRVEFLHDLQHMDNPSSHSKLTQPPFQLDFKTDSSDSEDRVGYAPNNEGIQKLLVKVMEKQPPDSSSNMHASRSTPPSIIPLGTVHGQSEPH